MILTPVGEERSSQLFLELLDRGSTHANELTEVAPGRKRKWFASSSVGTGLVETRFEFRDEPK